MRRLVLTGLTMIPLLAPAALGTAALGTAALATAALAPAAFADEAIGRYQMVPLPARPGSFDRGVLILDTRDGYLWEWWDAPVVGTGSNGSGITFMGKVVPGSAAGDSVPIHRGRTPDPDPPRPDPPRPDPPRPDPPRPDPARPDPPRPDPARN